MKLRCVAVVFALLATMLLSPTTVKADEVTTSADPSERKQPTRVFTFDLEHMQRAKKQLAAGDESLQPAARKLREEAEEALKSGPFSVTHKEILPDSGDIHDYHSRGPYWWPDPSKPNGRPYINRDGEYNPEWYKLSDYHELNALRKNLEFLSVAYYFFEDERYAQHAAKLLRTFFLDPETKMNPHLQYAQAIPGRTVGRDVGIIDWKHSHITLDDVGLIEVSDAWTEEDRKGFDQWCTEYFKWLLESDYGKHAFKRDNNHGTFYDVQAVAFALFLGQKGIARKFLMQVPRKRFGQMISTGEQPRETRRANGWGYSVANLRGYTFLARFAEHLNINLYRVELEKGKTIRNAFLYLAPYAGNLEEWPHGKLNQKGTVGFESMMYSVADQFPDETFHKAVKALPPLDPQSLQLLTGTYTYFEK